jgi:hypothetical protein
MADVGGEGMGMRGGQRNIAKMLSTNQPDVNDALPSLPELTTKITSKTIATYTNSFSIDICAASLLRLLES